MALVVPAPGNLKAILINNNAEKTNKADVDLTLSASGAISMMISNDSSFGDATWEQYLTTKRWTLLDEQVGPGYGDGEKTVYVKFKSAIDESAIYYTSIILKTSPPIVGSVPVLINGGRVKTEDRQVTLQFNVLGASYVEIFNEIDLSTYTKGSVLPYGPNVDWTLSEGNGTKTVYAVFIDDLDNRSAFFSDSIILIQKSDSVSKIQQPIDTSTTTDRFIDVSGTGNPEETVRIRISEE